MKVHHIGYAVKNMSQAKEKFLQLGYQEEQAAMCDEIRNVEILFLKNGELRVELIAPLEGKTPVDTILKKNGSIPYHICYVTEDLDKELNCLEREWRVVEQPMPAPALFHKRVAFLYNKEVGLIELLEE